MREGDVVTRHVGAVDSGRGGQRPSSGERIESLIRAFLVYQVHDCAFITAVARGVTWFGRSIRWGGVFRHLRRGWGVRGISGCCVRWRGVCGGRWWRGISGDGRGDVSDGGSELSSISARECWWRDGFCQCGGQGDSLG